MKAFGKVSYAPPLRPSEALAHRSLSAFLSAALHHRDRLLKRRRRCLAYISACLVEAAGPFQRRHPDWCGYFLGAAGNGGCSDLDERVGLDRRWIRGAVGGGPLYSSSVPGLLPASRSRSLPRRVARFRAAAPDRRRNS